MRKHPVNELLNELKWKKEDAVIEVADRMNPNIVKEIALGDIEKIGKAHFICSGTYIPFHRIKKIYKLVGGEKRVVWSK